MTTVSADERRSLWGEVLRWPLRGGMLGGVLLLTTSAAALAALEGGYTAWSRERRAWGQALVGFAAFAVIALYARRALACTVPVERPVPWGKDAEDDAGITQKLGNLATVLVIAFLPLALWLMLRGAIGAPGWLQWTLVAVLGVAGASLLPLGYAASFVKGSLLAALPPTTLKVWRAEPRAARIAGVTAGVAVGLLIASFWMASAFVRAPVADVLSDRNPGGEPEVVGPVLRAAFFAVRAAAFFALLVSFRVAGLLVREVPEVEEALR